MVGKNQKKALQSDFHIFSSKVLLKRPSFRPPSKSCCGLFLQKRTSRFLFVAESETAFSSCFIFVCLFVTFPSFFLFLIGLESMKVASEVWVKVAATFTSDRRTEQRRRRLCLPIVFFCYCRGFCP